MQLIMKRISYLFLLAIVLPFTANAQMEHKFTGLVSIGVPLIKSAGNISAENIYYGYKSIPYLGVAILYNSSTHFGIGGNLRQLYTTKPNYEISHTSLGLLIKYNILPSDKKISPFVNAELSTGYMMISQKANTITEQPAALEDKTHVIVQEWERSYPEIKTGFGTYGAMLGIGADFTIKLKYGLFVSANYYLSDAHKTGAFKGFFEENKSTFNFLLMQAGVKFSFGKSKSIY